MIRYLLLLIIVCSITKGNSFTDSSKVYDLDEITIIGNKFENKIIERTSGISVIKSDQLKQFGVEGISKAFNLTSGFISTSVDGFGKEPIISSRGYYGGGEAEYVSLFYDGILLNDIENGLINWGFMAGNNFDLEIYKGGASSLYGDYALGGVINISPNFNDSISNRITFNLGNNGIFNSGYTFKYKINRLNVLTFLSTENIEGYRKHSSYRNISFGANLDFLISESSSLKFILLNQISNTDKPGVNTEDNIKKDDKNTLQYFKEDNKNEKRHLVALRFKTILNPNSDLTAMLSYKYKKSNNIETFINIAPIIEIPTFNIIGVMDTTFFGDTNEREFISNNINSNIFLYYGIPNNNIKMSFGNELDYSFYNNKYYNWFYGFEEDYRSNDLRRNNVNFEADGNRFKGAFYLNIDYKILNNIIVNFGLRYDYIKDKFNGIKPDTSYNISSNATSPKIGINLKLSNNSSIYVNYNKSFKAPNVYQLTDLKQLDYIIFINPAPNLIISNTIMASPFANNKLKPQISDNFELGYLHSFNPSTNSSYYLSVAGYLNKIKDEIDFDLSSYQYQNLLKTYHAGIEAEVMAKINKFNLFGNFTYCDAKFDGGINDGKVLKGIPKNFGNFGVTYKVFSNFTLGLAGNYIGKIYLDDENQFALNDYLLFNIFAKYSFSIIKIDISGENIFNKKYFMPGYILGNSKLLYPSIGVIFKGGISIEF
ncbi:MAG TPA: TonB-dependent receptor [Melioribacteraceae bacterium]|nr:TonB-dependent receptor [Melioribacteraceae bacterium]